eukprot:GHRR01024360.1.p1 GENE.GHRR01024360.1~~GHRR01024360.1.p1  ORF type:complete len:130 (+),score=21.16 GHRR01024360.1:1164-1553(+)
MAAMLTPFAGWTCSLNSNKQCKPCQVLSRHAPVSDCSSLTCIQVVLGRDYPQETVDYLGSLYRTWAKGLLDWPYLDLPFTGYGRAKKAQRDLYKFFQVCVYGPCHAMAIVWRQFMHQLAACSPSIHSCC